MNPLLVEAGLDVFGEPFTQAELSVAERELRTAPRLELSLEDKESILAKAGIASAKCGIQARPNQGEDPARITVPQAAVIGSIVGLGAMLLLSLVKGGTTHPKK